MRATPPSFRSGESALAAGLILAMVFGVPLLLVVMVVAGYWYFGRGELDWSKSLFAITFALAAVALVLHTFWRWLTTPRRRVVPEVDRRVRVQTKQPDDEEAEEPATDRAMTRRSR